MLSTVPDTELYKVCQKQYNFDCTWRWPTCFSKQYISTPLYTSTAHSTVTSEIMEWSSCCRFTAAFAWSWYSSTCFTCIPPRLVV